MLETFKEFFVAGFSLGAGFMAGLSIVLWIVALFL
jgi:hypothetical protein